MNENPNEKIELQIHGVTIHSLSELRNHFDPNAVLKAYEDGSLLSWLKQHYYERETLSVMQLQYEKSDCIEKLCTIFNIDYPSTRYMSSEEQNAWNSRKNLIAQYTSDNNVLNKIHLVAMNQEELAALLDQGRQTIYLCNATFSIPIKMSAVKYIGIGRVTLENAYTAEQYRKCGIKIINILLPNSVSPEMENEAKLAAAAYGYDDFGDTHNPFMTAFHEKLKAYKPNRFHGLNRDYANHAFSETFSSKSDCEAACKRCIKEAYESAEQYLQPGNAKSFSTEAADFYSKWLKDAFAPLKEELKTLCTMNNTNSAFNAIEELIKESHKNLLAEFEEELQENSYYYKMYDLNYFIEKTDVETLDLRLSDNNFLRFIETMIPERMQYMVSKVHEPLDEMQDDLEKREDSFFKKAFQIYQEYILKIEKQLELIGKNLPEMAENESLEEYLTRMSEKKAS